MSAHPDLIRRLASELLGTALLVATVVGSGIMAASLSSGNDALALLGNTIATGAMLVVLITVFGPVSGAHFNPAVSLVMALDKKWNWMDLAFYWIAQLCGALIGVALAHALFELPIVQASTNERSGLAQALSEAVATFALLAAILGANRWQPTQTPIVVGLVIVAGYWWTASTSFANPVVTLARAFTESFSGIRLIDVPPFILAQCVGALFALFVFRWLLGAKSS